MPASASGALYYSQTGNAARHQRVKSMTTGKKTPNLRADAMHKIEKFGPYLKRLKKTKKQQKTTLTLHEPVPLSRDFSEQGRRQ